MKLVIDIPERLYESVIKWDNPSDDARRLLHNLFVNGEKQTNTAESPCKTCQQDCDTTCEIYRKWLMGEQTNTAELSNREKEVLAGMIKEYELLAKYNGGLDYERYSLLLKVAE